MPTFSSLQENLTTDVCVVGAGMAGLSTAYMLTQAGKKVVVLDYGPLCEGMTQFTTAHLASALDDRYVEIERLHGERGACLAAQSHATAIDKIETIVAKEMIDCNFQRLNGYLFLGEVETKDYLDRELQAAHRAGLDGVRLWPRFPLADADIGPCLCFPQQAQFHPLFYLEALARAIVRDGGQIYTYTHVDKIEGALPLARVVAGDYTVEAGSVVIATNSPVNDLLAIHTKQSGYMSYVIGARVPKGSVPTGLYWDTDSPYHYVRLQAAPDNEELPMDASTHEFLIVGGEDHKVGQADDTQERHDRLEAWARRYFPMMEDVEYRWAGVVRETMDGLAFIGRNPLDTENVYVCTGESGMGMTHGTIAGMLLTDLIQGRENPWTELYEPSRKTMGAVGTYIAEGINTFAQYRDWLTAGDVKSTDDIVNGQGAIVRRGFSKIAAYRDDDGKLTERSAVCPHLGGIVRWNASEKTWDCPCHSSRFDKFGEVIMGPANTPLAQLNPEK
jgi:glycine/D-amino acid oxidase-like deaminating enzyme/nitrite reductase/ring-hydroxylating ferredoxin subunit